MFQLDESPLTGADFSTRSVVEIVAFLKSWRPKEELREQTMTALAQELRRAVDQDPRRYAVEADQFVDLAPIYVRSLLEGLQNAARHERDFPSEKVLNVIQWTLGQMHEPGDSSAIEEGDDPNWLWGCAAGTELLKALLRRGESGISYQHVELVQSIVFDLLEHAPQQPELEDFEERFQREPYFGAEATLRGSAVELCILLIFWLSKHRESPIASAPRDAIANMPYIRSALEGQLTDHSLTGRIPRAILGRYLNWIFYFGEDWLRANMDELFPSGDDALRRATWLAHLGHDQGPIINLLTPLLEFYADEIARLTNNGQENDREFREHRLVAYLINLHICGALPDELLQQFWRVAPIRLRRYAMWCLGNALAMPSDQLPEEVRARGRSYWDRRLSSAKNSSDPDAYREELGAIGQ